MEKFIFYLSALTNQCGLIILGNSGAGKSFICNILIGKAVFAHAYQPEAVTHNTDFYDVILDSTTYRVFDIPGLIEPDQKQIDSNGIEIQKACKLCPSSVVLFVFSGGCGGRLLEEDLITFRAINEAYKFDLKSLVFAINNLSPTRDKQYEGKTTIALQKYLNLSDVDVCFLNHIDINNPSEKDSFRHELAIYIAKGEPTAHTSYSNIEIHLEDIKQLKMEFKENIKEFQQRIQEYQQQINNKQIEYDNFRSKAETDIKNLKEKLCEYEKKQTDYDNHTNAAAAEIDNLKKQLAKRECLIS
ncbi:unnamed protein product [Didymodactylos carnosus]|uniref:AIG1-type G domain-containing protein n=1 Tax=Didymodactylos carnosus TaxID=1234261 RepID=A0A814ZNP5_9BILA|nr:unnamed protein product [Didymodactylos carnosus]CAF4012349.1 unnamed protein product [Didymodactylos carnosus]